ncbi:MAG: hypothetical protein ACE5HV_18300, partial [Acidobacteriota bacterium]
ARRHQLTADPLQRLRPPDSPKSAEAKARAEGFRERLRTIDTLELLTGFCEALAGRPGRTALVWISSGFHVYEQGPWEFFYPDRARGVAGLDTPDLNIFQLQDELHRAANSANISIYSVDPMRQRSISVLDAQMTGTAGLARISQRLAAARAVEKCGL